MPPPIPSIPKHFLEEHIAAAHTDVDVKMQEWEEPHPGRRLSYPHDRSTNWDAFTGDAGYRGGMAAEGQWPGKRKFSFTVPSSSEQRTGRGRTKEPPSQLTFSESDENIKPEIHTAPLLRPVDLRRGNSNVSMNSLAPELAPCETGDVYSADVSGTDSDTEGLSIAAPRRKMSLAPIDTTVHGLTDFSNHLGIRMEVDGAPSSYSKAGTEGDAFCIMSPENDLYGWDAMLTRKTTKSHEMQLAPYQQRRASRSKRSLLQRVFSPGGSASGEETTENAPTSFAWTKHDEL